MNRSENSSLNLTPYRYPDELHSSQASRYHFHSGNQDEKQSFLDLYGTKPFRITSIVPPNLRYFSDRIAGKDPRQRIIEILRANTLAPLFEAFHGKALTDLATQQGLGNVVPKRTVGEMHDARLCLSCLKDDFNDHGEPYIHRSHQNPGIYRCHDHGTELHTRCPLCRNPFSVRQFKLVLAPWQRCACGFHLYELPTIAERQAESPNEIALARFGMEMLNLPTRPIQPRLVSHIYRTKLSELGFGKTSRIDRPGLEEALTEHYGEALLAKTDYAVRMEKANALSRILTPAEVSYAPICRHLLLANFLFANATVFWTYVDYQEEQVLANPDLMFRRAQKVTAKVPDEQPLPEESKIQAKIREALVTNPQWTIDDLWAHRRRVMTQLLAPNPEAALLWLNALMQPKPRSVKTRISSPHADDEKWAKRVCNAALQQYRSISQPVKLTRNRLLQLIGWKYGGGIDKELYPATAAKLEEFSESFWHSYARKIIWSLITNGGPGVADHRIYEPVKLEHYRSKDLIKRFASMPHKVSMAPSVVMEWLQHFQIPLDWQGPEKQDHYYQTGRNYRPVKQRLHEAAAVTQ